jgi:hypothetical protein
LSSRTQCSRRELTIYILLAILIQIGSCCLAPGQPPVQASSASYALTTAINSSVSSESSVQVKVFPVATALAAKAHKTASSASAQCSSIPAKTPRQIRVLNDCTIIVSCGLPFFSPCCGCKRRAVDPNCRVELLKMPQPVTAVRFASMARYDGPHRSAV